MVSFICDACQETLKKAKLDMHARRCHDAVFSCVDCSTTFEGTAYRAHTSCISEAEKYQKALYKPTAKQLKKSKQAQKEAEAAPAVEPSPPASPKPAAPAAEVPETAGAKPTLHRVVRKTLKKHVGRTKNSAAALSLGELRAKVLAKAAGDASAPADAAELARNVDELMHTMLQFAPAANDQWTLSVAE